MKTKLINISQLTAVIMLTVVAFNGCSVDHSLDPQKYGRIYMPQARKTPAQHLLLVVDSIQTIFYGAAYGGPKISKPPIHVQFSVKPALVDSFNKKHLTSYPILPKDSYTLTQKEAVIPADSLSTAPLKLEVKTNGYIKAGGKKYLLPVNMKVTDGPIKVNEKLQTTYFLIKGKYVFIDRSNWTIYDYDNVQPNSQEGLATHIIDGDPLTYWLTEFTPNRPPPPHFVSIDMGSKQIIHGFKIVGRSNQKIGNPKKVTFKFSNDGKNWKNGESFTLPFNMHIITARVYLKDPVKARYFKFIVNSTVHGLKFTHCAEIYVF